MADLHHQRVLELARRNAQHYTSRYRSLLMHWLAGKLRRPVTVEPGSLPPVESGQVAVTWGGHATALVRYSRLAVLCDPVLSRSVYGVRREVAPGLALEGLADVDLVLVSHAAPDHLDLPTLARLSRGATVVVPPHAAARVSPLGFARLVELSVGSSIEHRGIEVMAEEAQHGERGSPAQSYVIRGDGPTVYFCGASGYFPGFADIGRRHWPDLALLPIGGYWPRSFRRRHMSPLDALYAFEDLRARVMVPLRYGTFALSYERVDDPERWLAELVAERHLERFVVRLGAGESRVFVPPGTAAYESSRYEVDDERAGDRVSGDPGRAEHAGERRPGEHRAGAGFVGDGFAGEGFGEALEVGGDPRAMTPDQLASRSLDRAVGERRMGAALEPAARARGPRGRGGPRKVALRAPTPTPAGQDPDALTMPGGAAAPRPPGPPPPPRRPPALIVDHDDETAVFDPSAETRVRDEPGVRGDDDDDDDDAGATHAIEIDMPETETALVPVPVPGSR